VAIAAAQCQLSIAIVTRHCDRQLTIGIAIDD